MGLPPLKVKLKVWLETGGEMAFGLGSASLLKEIDQNGSLAAAARELGMSYRAAWGRIKDIEAALGEKLLEKKGGNKSGYRLSPLGRKMLVAYTEWEEQVHAAALRLAREKFPVPVD
ncbi:molybdate transport system regulatory protein [Desulfobaculum bizertense DSM 18034]|uniref:Molybdate transport system regulatory protein n=2 Tax=Desulfobaculum TaxID=1433996 RepID=A0A1T4VT35_9BACT|nr:molybdate transport system regulatory protein [Desulfobaculum bizertense DSM 18034]